MSDMLKILQNFEDASSGKKPAGPADKGSMKAILESIQAVEECGDMPMEMPAQGGQPVTVSVTASGKDNVADLIALMQQAAGIEQHVDMPMAHDAHVDTDSHNIEMPSKDQEMDMATMRQIMAAGDKEEEPEEATEEEWDNAPDEQYGSEDDVLAVGDDLHRPKDRKAIRTNDPALETSIKEQLWAALNEKLTTEGRGRGKKKKASEDIKTTEGRGRGKKKTKEDIKTTEGRGRGRGKKKK